VAGLAPAARESASVAPRGNEKAILITSSVLLFLYGDTAGTLFLENYAHLTASEMSKNPDFRLVSWV